MNEMELRKRLSEVMAIVDEQAEDCGLWFYAETAPEAYLQQALRRLHVAIEEKSQEQCAVEAIKGLVSHET